MQTFGKIQRTCLSSSITFSMKPLQWNTMKYYCNMKSLLATSTLDIGHTAYANILQWKECSTRSKPLACVDLEQLSAWPASAKWCRIYAQSARFSQKTGRLRVAKPWGSMRKSLLSVQYAITMMLPSRTVRCGPPLSTMPWSTGSAPNTPFHRSGKLLG